MKSLKGYVSSRVFMGERCPQHIQNVVLRDYCKKVDSQYVLSGVEYAMNNSFLMLQQLIYEIPKIDGIVAYSLFQFPEIQDDRLIIYQKILKRKGEIHFAVEGLKITTNSEIDRVEDIWLVRQALPYCYNPETNILVK
ncbi:MAG: sporadic carbohydrate cluster protein, LIC12192 family [Gammaproteobacteria bacterium]|nr:sporadic carbohydrate cluster protein, LIC12192 family [Gammaproteobacteria bacterium]|tara:strand:- start:240 stop:653 length:414 start_codon:yes stop_codon:yes gene_type:complete